MTLPQKYREFTTVLATFLELVADTVELARVLSGAKVAMQATNQVPR
jgi:hypothetical protein